MYLLKKTSLTSPNYQRKFLAYESEYFFFMTQSDVNIFGFILLEKEKCV